MIAKARDAALLLLLLCLSWVAVQVGLAVKHVEANLTASLQHVDTVVTHVGTTVDKTNAVIDLEKDHLYTLEKMAALQQKKSLEIMIKAKDDVERFGLTIAKVNELVDNTNESLNNRKNGLIAVTASAINDIGNDANALTESANPVIQHTDDLVNSVAIKSSVAHMDASMGHIESMLEVGDKVLHPPKQSKGQRVFQWILQTVLGNAVQGAVRR